MSDRDDVSVADRPARFLVQGERGSILLPSRLDTLDEFRAWALSSDHPDLGRIDFIDGTVCVDLMTDRLESHGRPKNELIRVISNRVRELMAGECYSDVTRVALPDAGTSCEPDFVFVSFEALRSGRVVTTPSADGRDETELLGPPDLTVEVVSPSSVEKDTGRLLRAYDRGGVREYWLVDCRDGVAFTLHRRGPGGFEAAETDADGFAPSAVLGRAYRLSREIGPLDRWFSKLEER